MKIGLTGGGPSLGGTLADARRAESEGFAAYSGDAAELFGNIPAFWEEAEPGERRRPVAPLIERVPLDLESKRIGAFTPSPAFRSLLQGAVQRTD